MFGGFLFLSGVRPDWFVKHLLVLRQPEPRPLEEGVRVGSVRTAAHAEKIDSLILHPFLRCPEQQSADPTPPKLLIYHKSAKLSEWTGTDTQADQDVNPSDDRFVVPAGNDHPMSR